MKGLRSNDRHVKYNIGAAFDFICDTAKPQLSRAVRLYELQVAVLIGKKLWTCQRSKKDHPDNWIRVSRSALSAARTVARVRLLENIIAEKHPDAGRRTPLKKLVRDETTLRLLQQIITPERSKQLAYSMSWRELDELITARRREQTTYAGLYYFSLHIAIFGGDNSRCNWSRAAATLTHAPNDIEYGIIRKRFKHLMSESTAYKYKDEDNHFAAFIWLDHFGGRYLRPSRPIAASFTAKLLAKVDDTAALRLYLGQYDYIRQQLGSQDYKLPKLRLVAPIPSQRVSVVPLPEELAALIRPS